MEDFDLIIRLYDSQSRQKEWFKPRDPSDITMYVCGPTIYDLPHIGNARPAVVFDVLYRVLQHMYGSNSIRYARNFTDIDDKIIAAANKKGMTIDQITNWAKEVYLSNMDDLKVLRPTYMPHATNFIGSMNQMIMKMVNSDHAYVSKNGEVLFHVPSSKHKSLAKHDEDALDAGARVKVDPNKKDPRDFILWKPSKPGEPKFSSPYGDGRPGWHIECSAMISALFGETIDIHGGGQDLRFPHHEAEITQSYACWNRPLANYWLHNGMLTVDGKKMAKSQGNFVTVKEALQRYPGETIRFFLLKTHYRQPLDWTWDGLEAAHNELSKLYRKLQNQSNQTELDLVSPNVLIPLLDDLNTPKAISALHNEGTEEFSSLKSSANLLGLLQDNPEDWFKGGIEIDVNLVESLIEQRNEARQTKNWKTADKIRARLDNMGIVLEDNSNGTVWRKG